MVDRDTSDWPSDYTKLYITNDLKDIENASGMKRLQDDGKTVFLVRAKDSKTDAYTGGLRITIPENTPLDQTGGLPINLRICVVDRSKTRIFRGFPGTLLSHRFLVAIRVLFKNRPGPRRKTWLWVILAPPGVK